MFRVIAKCQSGGIYYNLHAEEVSPGEYEWSEVEYVFDEKLFKTREAAEWFAVQESDKMEARHKMKVLAVEMGVLA
jgi:hypothetical protein